MQPCDGALLVGNGRPAQLPGADAAIRLLAHDFARQQVGVEVEVHLVFANARINGGQRLVGGVCAQGCARKDHFADRVAGNVACVQQRSQVVRELGVNAPARLQGQDALRDVVQHGVDVGAFLAHQLAAFLDLLDHGVEGHDGLADLVVARHGHAVREVLAGGNGGHLGLHLADGVDDLPVQQQADKGQAQHRHQGDDGQRGAGVGQVLVERVDGLVFAAARFQLPGVDQQALLAQVLVHGGRHGGFGGLLLAGELETCGVVNGREIIFQALLRFKNHAALCLADGLFQLHHQGVLQCGLARDEFFVLLLGSGRVGRAEHRESGDLDVLELPHQLDRMDGAGHDPFGHRFDLLRAQVRVVERVAANTAQRREGQRDTDRRFNRMRPSIAPRKRHQAG